MRAEEGLWPSQQSQFLRVVFCFLVLSLGFTIFFFCQDSVNSPQVEVNSNLVSDQICSLHMTKFHSYRLGILLIIYVLSKRGFHLLNIWTALKTFVPVFFSPVFFYFLFVYSIF